MRIDFKISGFGDAWMRFIALAIMTEIDPSTRHVVYPSKPLVSLAKQTFEPWFDVAESGPADVTMLHYGLRRLLPGLLNGEAYYSPFYWLLRHRRPRTTIKDRLNDVAFQAASLVTRLSLPTEKYTFKYQGFMEIQGLKPFRRVTLAQFEAAAPAVLEKLRVRVQSLFPGQGSGSSVLVFPSGSAHQIMPPDFAAEYFRDARFAFHRKDLFASEYLNLGLSVVYFESPEDIFSLISGAGTVYSTDSFPAHLAQLWRDECYMLMSQQKAEMVVVPGFPDGQILHSLAPCHPCRSRARLDKESKCDAGRMYCHTWNDPVYVGRLVSLAAQNDLAR